MAVLEGSSIITFEDGREDTLGRGDCLNIPAHVRHRFKWTDPDRVTVWLAVFYTCSTVGEKAKAIFES